MPYSCITLLTDYGTAGGLVGALHAVAFGIAPGARVIDLDHTVPPQDVRLGALRLERLMPYTPPGVHVAVVDPGVGGDRRPLAIETAGRVFVGPDNGLLVWAAERCGPLGGVTVLQADDYWLPRRSRTFDGRDIFVPVAAHIAAGVGLDLLGPRVDPASLVTIERPAASARPDGSIVAEVVQVDGFGNVQLAADAVLAGTCGLRAGGGVSIETQPAESGGAGGGHMARLVHVFGDVAAGELLLHVDSDGFLAVSVNRGSAAERLGVRAGDVVELRAAAR